MPVFCTRHPRAPVGLVRCFGLLTEQEFLHSIRYAFGALIFEPGLDRIVTLDRGVELHQLDANALRRIREHVVLQERRDGRSISFRSVLVSTSGSQQPILSLYKAIWEELQLPGVAFSVVAREDEAWEKLNLPRPDFQPAPSAAAAAERVAAVCDASILLLRQGLTSPWGPEATSIAIASASAAGG